MAEESKSGCLKAFLIFILVLFLLVGGGAYYLYRNFGSLLAGAGASTIETFMNAALSAAKFPQSEVDETMTVIRKFTGRVRSSEVSIEEMGKVAEKLFSGPAFLGMLMQGFEHQVLPGSPLSEEEKKRGKLDVGRMLQGISAGAIPAERGYAAIQPLLAPDDGQAAAEGDSAGPRRIRENIDEKDLRTMLSQVRGLADEYRIEEKEFQFDLSTAVDAAIQQALTETRAQKAEPPLQ